ncbi:IclR family transcriptional regulator [Rhodobacteraceae bacterium]|nr:IclR family transcriptional regulator [Paracoccaceae bacterium]
MIQSVSRALHILELLAHSGGSARLKEISHGAGLNVPTAHNLLKTLIALGYVIRRTEDARYHLGDRVLNLARVAGNDDQLRERLRPVLEAVQRETAETAFVAVPSGDRIYFLDVVESSALLRVSGQKGERVTMVGSAIGQLFLAYNPALRARTKGAETLDRELGEIARQGYALDHEQVFTGVAAVAVPWMEDGEMRAGFGVTGPGLRMQPERLPQIARQMQDIVLRNRLDLKM